MAEAIRKGCLVEVVDVSNPPKYRKGGLPFRKGDALTVERVVNTGEVITAIALVGLRGFWKPHRFEVRRG